MKPYHIVCLCLGFAAAVVSGCRKDPDNPKRCRNCPIAYKPNIYIYPQQALDLAISLDFPKGGGVVASIPDYGSGWQVRVTPEGRINDRFDYLFYESKQPDEWQDRTGWVVAKDSLEHFFTTNLQAYHFQDNEINDFNIYWLPRLKDHPYYKIYPQEAPVINALIQVRFSQAPDHFLRLFYLIEGVDQQPPPPEPHVIGNTVLRTGYHAAEWGVVLK